MLTVLLWFSLQIAGAAAAAGAPLAAVADLARSVAGRCATLGVALHGCTLPGHPPNTRWVRWLVTCP
jgi:dihydroxyacetone kinase